MASFVLVACLAGCAQPASQDRFIPAPELARAAVAAVLDDWKEGRASETIDRLSVGIQVIDTHRKQGQRLDDFEILGETPGEAPRCFAVRLKLSQPEAEETVRYAVVGIDPLLVFRHEDLEMLNHWDHVMPSEAPVEPQSLKEQNEESNAESRDE